jgi:hypothetical protein
MTPPRTWYWYIFDVLFGVIVPVACFYYDPILLKTTLPDGLPMTCNDPVLGRTSAYFVYPAAAIAILSLLCWLIIGQRLPKWSAFFSGIFGASTISAIVIGLPLVILGFPAWLAAIVFGRSAKDAWEFTEPGDDRTTRRLRALGGVVLLCCLAGIAYYLLLALFPPIVQTRDCKTIFSNS